MSLALWEYFWSTGDWVISTSTAVTPAARRPLITITRRTDIFDVRM